MNRRKFIATSCTACMGAAVLPGFLAGCKTTAFASGTITNNRIVVDTKAFMLNGQGKYRSYIIVRNEALQFPVCIYRFNDTEYTAIWMQCAHQGAELNVAGDRLHCPAHGSEYNNRGRVTNGPADGDLKTFPVTINNNELLIDLRKI